MEAVLMSSMTLQHMGSFPSMVELLEKKMGSSEVLWKMKDHDVLRGSYVNSKHCCRTAI